ncbi:MAG TPA: hypothetical protein VJH95_01940 [Candidatus Nanoarchaeia archaeon]|nr:hypothetical protein [Candidatus Nanoarchaeia archaeon]
MGRILSFRGNLLPKVEIRHIEGLFRGIEEERRRADEMVIREIGGRRVDWVAQYSQKMYAHEPPEKIVYLYDIFAGEYEVWEDQDILK